MDPQAREDAVAYAANAVDTVALQVAAGETTDPTGDLVERCTGYYARGLGITAQEINQARETRAPGR